MQFCDFASFGTDPTVTLGLQGDLATNTHIVSAPNGGSKNACAPCKNVPKSKVVIKKHVSVVSATTDLWKNTMFFNMSLKVPPKPMRGLS